MKNKTLVPRPREERDLDHMARILNGPEFARYGGSHAMEIIPATLYDTQALVSGVTRQLVFFRDFPGAIQKSNLVYPAMMPDAQSFLIRKISISGCSSEMVDGVSRLVIMNKHYGFNPILRYALKSKGMDCFPALLLPPMASFEFTIFWSEAPWVRGFDGLPRKHRVQVTFDGLLARPTQ